MGTISRYTTIVHTFCVVAAGNPTLVAVPSTHDIQQRLAPQKVDIVATQLWIPLDTQRRRTYLAKPPTRPDAPVVDTVRPLTTANPALVVGKVPDRPHIVVPG